MDLLLNEHTYFICLGYLRAERKAAETPRHSRSARVGTTAWGQKIYWKE